MLEGLGGEKDRWEQAALALGVSQDSLTGDCLLAATNIAYLGPYTGEYRASQLKLSISILKEENIAVAEEVTLQ